MREWIYGRRTVAEHLLTAPQTCRKLLVARESRVPRDIWKTARLLDLLIEEVPRQRLDEVAGGGNHQGVCLEVAGWSYRGVDALVARTLASGGLPLLIALDCVQDPGNLGAVIRVADGVGASGVLIPRNRAAGLSAAVARAAAGAVASVPVARVVNLGRTLDELKREGFWVLGLSEHGGTGLYETDVRFPSVVLLGGEHRGIRPNVARRCEAVASIPMRGKTSNLNVAVATGIVCYELLRRFRAEETKVFFP